MRFTTPAFQIFCMLLLHALCYAIPKNSLEPTEEDLQCFNDYESEMKCQLSSENCSEYKLNITQTVADELNKYSCVFKQSRGSATDCECKVKVPGFVLTEIFKTTLLKGVNVLFTKELVTKDFIKPKTPVLTVQKTDDGNFRVTWDSKYPTEGMKSFVDGLRIKLYEIKGKEKKELREILNTVGFDDIISSNLHPNTEYFLTATMITNYNNYRIESDESEPLSFTTPPSPYEKLKMIPVVCVALISVIFIIVISVFSIKRVWWDKISKPKINLDFGQENIKTLPYSFVPISNIQADIPKSDLSKEKKWIFSSDTSSEKSSDSVDSASVDYAQTVSGTPKGFNVLELTEQALKEAFKLPGSPMLTPMSSSYNQVPVVSENNLGTTSQKECNRSNRDSGNCSASSFFSNLAYLESPGDNSSFLEPLTCDTSYMKESIINSDNYPDTGMTQLNDNGMLTDNKLVVSQNPLYPTLHNSNVIVCDNEYQDVRTLSNTKEKWILTTSTEEALGKCGAMKVFETVGNAPSFQQCSLNPSLHIMPGIEMVDAYHPV